ncbi:hypothetical protein CXB51_003368 [Gossypium anomalum]|uniref:Homeobox domain-containing protein n=1 Tax=Gossypium anomalum TaxID=47600 RepID=A0A8J6DBK3_9ROSI|nr:hypothetical protein CXB51_003368 [Gossypium anomalum]
MKSKQCRDIHSLNSHQLLVSAEVLFARKRVNGVSLELGDPSKPFSFLDKTAKLSSKDLGFCMGLGNGFKSQENGDDAFEGKNSTDGDEKRFLQIHLFSLIFFLSPQFLVPSLLLNFAFLGSQITVSIFSRIDILWGFFNHLEEKLPTFFFFFCIVVIGDRNGSMGGTRKRFRREPSTVVAVADEAEEKAAVSSPNSAVSMDFGIRNGSRRGKKEVEVEAVETERTSTRASDDDDNGSTRKKLRLSKEQSAFLEESFKEHSTLNPVKAKLALAKQLNLRPRQIEVWFQNRRASDILKQDKIEANRAMLRDTAEENKRLQKELQDLRALKTSQPFYMQLPATTLTMCPSCERVATASTTNASASTADAKTGGYTFFSSTSNT